MSSWSMDMEMTSVLYPVCWVSCGITLKAITCPWSQNVPAFHSL